MAKPEWGTKRQCQGCGAKFYDLGRAPIICPKCSAKFDPESLLRSRRNRPSAPAKAATPAKVATPAKAVVAEVGLDEDLAPDLTESEEDEDVVIEDTSEMGDDEDMSEVVVADDDEED